jgi:N-acetylglucosaminyldiphosphoundecaprenol N-acetyl-beta-D-mannosaminyltransferase
VVRHPVEVSTTATSDLTIVIVAYRSEMQLPGLLAACQRHEPDARVVVVDNSPHPGEVQLPPHSQVIHPGENLGYGRACNLGAEQTSTDFIAFLNPDIRLQGPSLSELAAALHSRPAVGIATGPTVDRDGERIPAAWGPPSSLRGLLASTDRELRLLRSAAAWLRPTGSGASGRSRVDEELEVTGHVLGGAMVVRRACFEAVGGFDPDFFLYWEDADLCRRARKRGWEVMVLPCTPIVHDEGKSSTGVTSERRWLWFLEGADTYGRKHLTSQARRRLLMSLRIGRALRKRRSGARYEPHASADRLHAMRLNLGGTHVAALEAHELIERLRARWRSEPPVPLSIASANLDHLYHFGRGAPLSGVLQGGSVEWVTTLDGMPVVWYSRWRAGRRVAQLAGSDLLPVILSAAECDGVRVAFVGGRPEMHQRLRRELARTYPGLVVAGFWSPERSLVEDVQRSEELALELRQRGVELLVVGLGKPRQEVWLSRHLPTSGASVGLAFGAAADFLAGTVPRAPASLRRWGLEWAYRLVKDPRRLWRRYLLQGPVALWRLLRHSTSSRG